MNHKIRKSDIISVSRRTDIPAFYGEWFVDKLKKGVVGFINPFNRKISYVSLKKDDVKYFVFWSKNFISFTPYLKWIKERGFNFYFNYTINNYSAFFEKNLPDTKMLIDNLKLLSKEYSPISINWRYDPIVICDKMDFDFHKKNFEFLAKNLSGYVKRCYFSYVTVYPKVRKSFGKLDSKVELFDISDEMRISFANELASIAENYEIKLYSCCADYLVLGKINKGSCIDNNVLKELFDESKVYKEHPTRKECHCVESIDIGVYNSCMHNCIYCYANDQSDKRKAFKDVSSLFLC